MTSVYTAQLVVYDQHLHRLLTDGDYEVVLQEVSDQVTSCGRSRASWETISGHCVSTLVRNRYIVRFFSVVITIFCVVKVVKFDKLPYNLRIKKHLPVDTCTLMIRCTFEIFIFCVILKNLVISKCSTYTVHYLQTNNVSSIICVHYNNVK